MTLAALGRQAKGADGAALERLLVWAEGEPSSLGGGWIRIAAYLLPVTLVVTILADVYLGAPALWIIPAVPQLWMLRRFNARLAPDFEAVASMGPALRTYGPQLESVAGWTGESACLQALLRRVSDSDSPAPAWLGELAGLADTAQSRTNMFYAVFAAFLLVDVHLGLRLERWRGLHGSKARDWLAALGEAEALSSLATLAHDQPEWTFPVWEGEGELSIEGQGLGHPLIPDASCVRNDVSLGPPGTFLLVTGSNMSGKSTLLRAIGTNVILAGAGAPVCAESLRLGPVRLCTSMSVEDSLEDGISLFMAQLLRVRDIVEIARKTEGGAAPVLFLLDEILHGTNSRERRVAAQAVVRHLLECGAIGTISTHDLELAEAPDLQDRAIPVHFREKVLREQGETRLEFDYLMRPGLGQSSNALSLLEAVGLGDGGAD